MTSRVAQTAIDAAQNGASASRTRSLWGTWAGSLVIRVLPIIITLTLGMMSVPALSAECTVDNTQYESGDIDPNNPCKHCDPTQSTTTFVPRPEGSGCSDSSLCTTDDTCTTGVCTGTVVNCDDDNACTVDTCQPATGCEHDSTALDGIECDDGSKCTSNGICILGLCLDVTAVSCDDENPCTADLCNPATGCINFPTTLVEVCYSGIAGTAGVGLCKKGKRQCVNGVMGPCVGQVIPTTDLCNTFDDDCDGEADEDFAEIGQACDGDDNDNCANGVYECAADGTSAECNGDLNEPELCDNKDNNCDGNTDEDFPTKGQSCDSPTDADSCKEGTLDCNTAGDDLTCTKDGPSLLLLADEEGTFIYSTADHSGHSNDGELLGAMGFDTGIRGRALSFDGIDDEVKLPASADLNLGKVFTVALYFKWPGGTGSVSLFESQSGACPDLAIRLNQAGAPYALIEQSQCGYASLPAGELALENQWQHIALTADGTNYKLYLNGKLKKTVAQSAAPLELSNFWLGKKHVGVSAFFTGSIDEVGVWRYALDQPAITDLVANGPLVESQNLEVCDSLDNDCDSATDENATAEICDGKDNNCNSQVDETFPTKGATCDDSDADKCSKGSNQCGSAKDTVACSGDGANLLWRFETGIDATVFDSAGTGHGNKIGGQWTDGVYGGGLELNDASHISLSNYSGIDLADVAQLTLEAHIKLISASAGTVMSRAGAYSLAIISGQKLSCTVEGVGPGGSAATVTGSTLSLSTWHHVACLYDGTALRLYENGVLTALSTGLSGKVLNVGSVFKMGPLHAAFDEIAVWDSVLPEATLQSRKTTGIPVEFTTREVCDTSDNNCNGTTNEGFESLGTKCDTDDVDTCANGTYTCTDSGLMQCLNDVPENGIELCNGQDDNCDGNIDETFTDKGKACDGDDEDKCANGVWQCSSDGLVLVCNNDEPKTEICNNIDDDCDGETDEGFGIGDACDGSDPDSCTNGKNACLSDESGTYCKDDGPSAAYYLSEGGGGTVSSSTGDAPDGTLKGSTSWTTGKVGGGLLFKAKGDRVTVASKPAVTPNAPMSATAWVKMGFGVSGIHTVMRHGPQSNPRFWIAVDLGGQLICGFGGLSAPKCQGSLSSPDWTQFHHVACTYDGSHISVFFNGALLQQCPAVGSLVSSAGPFTFGALDAQPNVPITLDEPSVWNTALSLTEVVSNAGLGEACDGKDNDCDGSTDEDFAAQGTACDGDDADECATGTYVCTPDALGLKCDGDTVISETCDGLDNDCDGSTDEDFPTKFKACDGDDEDKCANGVGVCSGDGLSVICSGDENEPEVCDGLDNDCNGTTDDNLSGLGVACDGTDTDKCDDGVTYCAGASTLILCDDVKSALWLKLDDSAGQSQATDSSRFKRHLSASGAAFGQAGKHGTAVAFSQAGTLTDSVNEFDTLSNLTSATWSAWVHPGTVFPGQTGHTIAAQWGTGNGAKHFTFRIRNQGVELGLRTNGDSNTVPNMYGCIPGADGCTTVIPLDEWTHIAVTFSLGELRFYIGGALIRVENTIGSVISPRTTSDILHVGAENAQLSNGFHGNLDSVAIYPRALTETEIDSLITNGPNGDTVEVCNAVDDDCDDLIDEDFATELDVTTKCDSPDANACSLGSYVCNNAETGVVCDESSAMAYWPLDDNSGVRAVDYSGGAHDALLHHDVSFTTNGKFGGAAVFNAASKSHGQAGNADLVGGKSSATWMAWIKPASLDPGKAPIISTHGVSEAGKGNTWAFGREGDGLFFRLRTNTNNNNTPTTKICNAVDGCGLTAGQWAHVAVVFSPPAATFYVNGAKKADQIMAGIWIQFKHPDERLVLASDTHGALGHWGGALDDVRVYGSALNATQITTIYDETRGEGKELCDGLDDDCDGETDEDYSEKGQACDGDDTDSCKLGTWTCKSDGSALECVDETETDITEECNSLDDDCDGLTDEDFTQLGNACDAADTDKCKEGSYICNTAGTALTCAHDGPVHLWRMNQGSGNAAVDTAMASGKNLTLGPGVTWDIADNETALSFSGTQSFAVNSSVDLSGTKTIELWIRPTAGNAGYVYGQSTAAKLYFGGKWEGDAFTHYQYEASGDLRSVTAIVPAGAAYHHIVVTINPVGTGGLNLYVNGDLKDSDTLLSNTGGGEFSLGRLTFSPTTELYVGFIDDAAVYDFLMPAKLISEHANTGLPSNYENRELCDSVDNDCNGKTDEGLTGGVGAPCDGDDDDDCATGTFQCATTQLDVECTNETNENKNEECNNIDDDCDGETDEGFTYNSTIIGLPCVAPGVCGAGVVECVKSSAAGCSTGPDGGKDKSSLEACDLLDNDCDGDTDEKSDGDALTQNCYSGPDGTKGVGPCKGGLKACTEGSYGTCVGEVVPAASDKTCDLVDEDCDGNTDEEYADDIVCTVDTCVNGVPASQPSDANCDDANPCTDDTCTATAPGSGCTYISNDDNVPDPVNDSCGNSCKKPVCDGGVVTCIDDPGAIPNDSLVCTADKCTNGVAEHQILADFCLIDGECYSKGAVNEAQGCQVCAPHFNQEKWGTGIHFGDFDEGGGKKDGYVFKELANGGISWGVTPNKHVTPEGEDTGYSLFFGDEATLTYESGARVAASATSPTMTAPPGVKLSLSFYVWMETEGYTGSQKFDTLIVEVVNTVTAKRTEVWNSMSTMGSNTGGVFERVFLDISTWAGKSIQIVFTFDSGDAYFNEYGGIYLDKIRVETACCLVDGDCYVTDKPCILGKCEPASKMCKFTDSCSGCIRRQTSVVFLIDKSESMKALTPTGKTRWEVTKEALSSVLAAHDEDSNLGFKLYPAQGTGNFCSVTQQLDLDFHASVDAMNILLQSVNPSGQTPMAAALFEAYTAYQSAAANLEAGNKYVVLMTDGMETCNGDVLQQISALGEIGVRTVVVAFDSAATKAKLNEMAVAGGLGIPMTDSSNTSYLSATGLDTLMTALNKAMALATGEACNKKDDDCDLKTDNDAPDIACNIECNEGLGGKQVCYNGGYLECDVKSSDEVCDDKDNDCDGSTDEDWPKLGKACKAGSGDCISIGKYICSAYLTGPEICDAMAIVQTAETCNNKDDDCDSVTDEELYKTCWTTCGTGYETCVAGIYQDCTATAPKDETCNGLDDDCNDAVDDLDPEPCTGVCGQGVKTCNDGVLSACSADAAPEVCDNKDNDCDGNTDEGADGGVLSVACVADANLSGPCGEGTQECKAGGVLGTCLPDQKATSEVCDGIDNDCDGDTDENVSGEPVTVSCYSGPDGTKGVGICTPGIRTCVPGGTLSECTDEVVPTTETCDGKDNNCDGDTDEDAGNMCAVEIPSLCGSLVTTNKCLCGADPSGNYSCYLD